MPIAGALAPLQSQLKSAITLDIAAEPEAVATLIASSIASIAPTGMFPAGAAMIPLAPAGLAATQSQIKNALTLDVAAEPETVAQLMAAGIAALCPIVPPSGLAPLQTQIKSAITLDIAAEPDTVAQMLSSAIISYFTAGGVV